MACEFLLLVVALMVECYTCDETNIVTTEQHTVTTEQGDIIGYKKNVLVFNEERTVRRYLGIPYAKPPIGGLRFKKPVEPDLFVEQFQALTFGAACPQIRMAMLPILEDISEDCLFLNIFVPAGTPDQQSGFPVMVFVHGGGFDYGTGNSYFSDNLASYGNVIVVTINYRLGLFGFLSTNDEHAPGNVGLWDQHLAFKWVHKNIGAFDGDNGRVTIFGESAGAVSVMMHALYPGNKGLFQRVIAESGSALMWALFKEDHSAANRELAQYFSCDVGELVSCLNNLNSSAILDKLAEAMKDDMEAMLKLTFRPTVDNDFFNISPFQMAENKDKDSEEFEIFRSLDLINGVSSDEGSYIVAFFTGGNDSFQPTREMMNSQLVSYAFMLYPNETPNDFVTKMTLSEYTDWSNPDEPTSIRAEFSRLVSDLMFNVGAIEQSRMHCSSRTTGQNFFYIFDTDSNMSFFPKPSWTNGAVHGEELAFVFGLNEDMLDMFNMSDRKDGLGIGICERKLSKQMMRFWSNFASYGDPNGQRGSVDKEWPQYDLDTQKAIVISEKYSNEGAIRHFPYAQAANFWINIIPAAFNASRSSETTSGSGSSSAEGDCDEV